MKKILSLFFLLISCSAHAEPYVFAGFGPVAEINVSGVNDSALPSWIGAGYRRGPLAVEADYLMTSQHDFVISNGRQNLFERTWSGQGVGAFGVYHFGQFLFRGGMYRLHSKTHVIDNINLVDDTKQEDFWSPSISFGWEGKIEMFTVRLSAERIRGHDEFKGANIGGITLIYGF